MKVLYNNKSILGHLIGSGVGAYEKDGAMKPSMFWSKGDQHPR